MSTTYDWISRANVCPACGRGEEVLEIGVSAAGWYFALNVYPDHDPPINDLADWRHLWTTQPDQEIQNEYGQVMTPGEMVGIITERSHPRPPTLEILRECDAISGVRNLLYGRGSVLGLPDGSWVLIRCECEV